MHPEPRPDAAAPNVLIVDDSTMMRTMIKRVMGVAGLPIGAIYEAANGEEALEMLEHHDVRFVFTDINMPVMNGLELMTEVKNNPAYKKNKFIPFVMLTAVMGEDLKEKALAVGARAYLVKPFQPPQVLDMVQKLIP